MFATLIQFAQSVTYTLPQETTTATNHGLFSGLFGGAFITFYLLLVVVTIASMCKIFTKAGRPGWAAIVPVYNLYILLQIVGRPWWWLLLMLIPGVGAILGIILTYDLCRSFGEGVGMTLLLVFVTIVGMPLLAFGPYTYRGPAAAPASAA